MLRAHEGCKDPRGISDWDCQQTTQQMLIGSWEVLPDLSFYDLLCNSCVQIAVLLAPVAYSRHISSTPFLTLASMGTDKVCM